MSFLLEYAKLSDFGTETSLSKQGETRWLGLILCFLDVKILFHIRNKLFLLFKDLWWQTFNSIHIYQQPYREVNSRTQPEFQAASACATVMLTQALLKLEGDSCYGADLTSWLPSGFPSRTNK